MKFQKVLIFFLIQVLLMLIVNNTLFRHFHYLPDGSGIEHAHPFFPFSEQENGQEHKHTSAELMILDSLFHLERILLSVVFLFIAFKAYFIILHRTVLEDLHPLLLKSVKQLRAPPENSYF